MLRTMRYMGNHNYEKGKLDIFYMLFHYPHD